MVELSNIESYHETSTGYILLTIVRNEKFAII